MEEKLLDLLIRHEALKLKPYLCPAGKLTIGIGRNLEDKGITEDEAIYMCRNDIRGVYQEASAFKWFAQLSENRKLVVLSMIFNVGFPRFQDFKKMIGALERKDFQKAAAEMLDSKWASQVGPRATELAQMMRAG